MSLVVVDAETHAPNIKYYVVERELAKRETPCLKNQIVLTCASIFWEGAALAHLLRALEEVDYVTLAPTGFPYALRVVLTDTNPRYPEEMTRKEGRVRDVLRNAPWRTTPAREIVSTVSSLSRNDLAALAAFAA